MNPKKRLRLGGSLGIGGASLAWVLAISAYANAQPAPAAPAPQGAAPPAAAEPKAAEPTSKADTPPAAAKTDTPPAAVPERPDPVAIALTKEPGGLTLDEVAKLALKTKPSIRAKEAEVRAAAAKVDQAFVNYFPRVSAAFTYTRLSDVSNNLGGNSGGLLAAGGVNTNSPIAITTGPCDPGNPTTSPTCTFATDAEGNTGPVGVFGLNFTSPNDNYSFTASIAVPVSDYLLRISQGHAAASHAEKSKKLELEAEMLIAAADAKVAYLNWVRVKGQSVVAKEAVSQATAHVEDVKRLKVVGFASQADVLRGEAQIAAAEQGVVEVEAFAVVVEEQVRIGLGLPKDKPLRVGVDVFGVSPTANLPDLATAQSQALEKRLEIRALDETELSLKEVESISRAGLFPRVDAFADLTIANPNQRFVPPQAVFNTTWDAGVRLSWTFNDTFTAIGAVAENKARVSQIAETKKQLRDGLRLEVTAAWTDMKKAAGSIDAATRSLTAAEEGLRIRRELFQLGKATSVEMLDSEAEVIRARLRKLDAQIALLVSQVKYDHAVGNDVGKVTASDAKSDKGDDDDASVKRVTNVAKATTKEPAKTTAPLLPLK